ncbi:MAG TPA: DUF2252 domain-containing protein [Thermoleophilia bacterium]|nr:DUF2252 domain-containing protein [Thermoleophilia bacterium]
MTEPRVDGLVDLPEIAQRRKGTPKQRAARGKEARKQAPRSAHAHWQPPAARPDPVMLLEEQAKERAAELVPIRYGRMLATQGTFYRGGALLMALDLADTPVSGLTCQLCGDAHLMNFGLFESPERRLIFDINDFDETLPGPWEWDVKRLATSFEVAGRDRGFDAAARRAIILTCVRSYREAMLEMAESRAIHVWHSSVDVDLIRAHSRALEKRDAQRIERDLSHAKAKDELRALSRLTEEVEGRIRLRSAPPLLVPARELLVEGQRAKYAHTIEEALRGYRSSLAHDRQPLYDLYRFRDMARMVVGVGSVGTRAWVLLFFGRDKGDPLFLQAKQAQASVLERFVGRSRYLHAGRRVVEGQRLMQAASDFLLGWYHVHSFDGRPYDFYVRQLWDGKGSFSVEALAASAWHDYARLCAWTLARAHARTGDRIAIAAYLGGSDVFDRAVADFAAGYAEQNQRDYEALRRAVDDGRVKATFGL